jgi:hypothetical protein
MEETRCARASRCLGGANSQRPNERVRIRFGGAQEPAPVLLIPAAALPSVSFPALCRCLRQADACALPL